jgi:hypothetical protein
MISYVDRVPAVDRTLSFAGARAAPAYAACPFDSETSSFKGKDSRAIARVASRKAPASCPRLTWHPRNDANLDPERSAAGVGHEHRVNVFAAAPCHRAALQPEKSMSRRAPLRTECAGQANSRSANPLRSEGLASIGASIFGLHNAHAGSLAWLIRGGGPPQPSHVLRARQEKSGRRSHRANAIHREAASGKFRGTTANRGWPRPSLQAAARWG